MTSKPNSQAANFKKAWAAIAGAQCIFMSTHESTDGDDLGSLLAVRTVLASMGKDTHCMVKGGVPHTLKFLPGSAEVKAEFENRPYDLIITFGCNKLERVGFPELLGHPARKINFDHHPDNSNFADINVVDPDTAAVAEMIYYFLQSNDAVRIDRDIATCLLTGIHSDTGGFQHANTSAAVYEVAGELIRKGARIDTIAQETIGKKRPQALKAWARALENTRFDPERKMVFSVMTAEDMAAVGADEEDLTGFVQIINHVPQAKFALLLRQDGDEIRGSLRSELHKGVDVNRIAKVFGGGGHKLASGFKIKGKLVRGDGGWRIEPR